MIDKALVQQARQTDLGRYLLSIGEPLTRNGRRYKHKNYDSLVFTKGAYYWNSRQEHGNAVDYLTRHKGMSFDEAVAALVGFIPPAVDEEQPELKDLKTNQDYRRSIAYLNKTRNIDYDVIKQMIKTKHIFQEADTNNIIFPMYDENGEFVGAEMQGTLTDKRFKGIKAGSKYGYGFNVRFGDTFDYALFFESAVDLLSFIDLKKNYEFKSLERCILVSMAGLKANILEHVLRTFTGKLRAVLCVDNDDAGLNFEKAVKELKIDYMVRRPEAKFKDWNEQLQSWFKQLKSS